MVKKDALLVRQPGLKHPVKNRHRRKNATVNQEKYAFFYKNWQTLIFNSVFAQRVFALRDVSLSEYHQGDGALTLAGR